MSFEVAEFCLQNVVPAGAICFRDAMDGAIELKGYKTSEMKWVKPHAGLKVRFDSIGASLLELAKNGVPGEDAIRAWTFSFNGPTTHCYWRPGGLPVNELTDLDANVYFAGHGDSTYVVLKNNWFLTSRNEKQSCTISNTSYHNDGKRVVCNGDTSVTAPVFNVDGVAFAFQRIGDSAGYYIATPTGGAEVVFTDSGKRVAVTRVHADGEIGASVDYAWDDPGITHNLVLPAEYGSVHRTSAACNVACDAVLREARNWGKHFDIPFAG